MGDEVLLKESGVRAIVLESEGDIIAVRMKVNKRWRKVPFVRGVEATLSAKQGHLDLE